MLLSVVIPTRNEAANITACLSTFVAHPEIETVVVDNFSDDNTVKLAQEAGVTHTLLRGPERCAQRNAGWQAAQGDYILFLDADMIFPEETLQELLETLRSNQPPDALYIPEVRVGEGLWIKARNLERSFYNATPIDALRVIRRELLVAVGGYDVSLNACEDWDLDRRIVALKPVTALLQRPLLHNERRLTFRKHLAKKAYYSASFEPYLRKWGRDTTTRIQFSLISRYLTIYLKGGNYKRALRHPLLMALIYLERFCVGVLYLLRPR